MKVVAPIKRVEARGAVVKCGGCHGTGVRHVWNSAAELIPTNAPCPSCDGTGAPKSK